MRQLIIEHINVLQEEKAKAHTLPAYPNDLELRQSISKLLVSELDALISEGYIKVVGNTVNRLKILRVEKQLKGV